MSDTKIGSVARPQLSRSLRVLSRLPFYVQITEGLVERLYVAADDTAVSSNIKRGLASLLQFNSAETQRTEVNYGNGKMHSVEAGKIRFDYTLKCNS